MHLSRVNEPFLDGRLFDFYKMINHHLPQARVSFFSNASVLDEKKIDRLTEITNVEFFVISLNDYRRDEYEKVMKIPYERTIKHIDALHKSKVNGSLNFPILLSRVGDATTADREFVSWCENRYPEFMVSVRPRGDWIGLTTTTGFNVPNAGCRQWFQLHFLADGRDAFCCIDAEGKFGFNQNVQFKHALEIYNLKERREIRESIRFRTDLDLCAGCTMYS
jgi:hypothetical protein